MNLYRRRHLYKNEVARGMGISPATLKRMMDKHHSEILKVSPDYSRNSQLLSPKIIDYLIEINGYTWEEILENDKRGN